MKNIVVCCDGTNNQLRGDLTNVVRIFEVAIKDERQVAYYDPGVGTLADPRAQGWLEKRWSLVKGLAFGAGFTDNVFDSYRYLMRVYEDGDRVFIFGFSRGAFAARVLAGMLHAVGLLHAGTDRLLPYLWKTYRGVRAALPSDASAAEQEAERRQAGEVALLRRSFTRPCPVAFLGPWDTVGSVGMYNWNQAFAHTFVNPSVAVVRHAVSLDEKRAAFRSNVFKADPTPLPGSSRPRVMNVWFPGVHCDVGGGYAWPDESGLAMIAFEWMVREAVEAGLLVDDAKLQELRKACPPDPRAEMHQSLKKGWKLIEYLPARRYDFDARRTNWRFQPNCPRRMRESPFLHRSVRERMSADPAYRPASLPANEAFPTED